MTAPLDAFATFAAIERCARQAVEPTILVPVTRAIRAILGVDSPGIVAPITDDRVAACVGFAEQFVVDVAGMTDGQRAAMAAAMGAEAFTFVQALFVTDIFTRARIAIDRLSIDIPEFGAASDEAADLWPLLERFMQQVAQLDALDPVTTELIRLRGARVHDCRLCRSRRSLKAIDAAGGPEIFDVLADDEHAHFSRRHLVALQLTDAMVTQPQMIDATLSLSVHEEFDALEISEIVLDVVRNAANKIAVAFGADQAVVTEGIEFYDIDANGDVIADIDGSIVRAATAC